MTTLTATDARREFFELVKRAAHGHKIYRIRHRSGAAVLMSEEDYESLMETLELLSIPGFRASMKRSVAQMKRGETVSLEEACRGQVEAN
jgi:antitoxin YefM